MQEVANPAITFAVDLPDGELPLLICDRRQIAQALTNLLKNATEAVAARTERDVAAATVALRWRWTSPPNCLIVRIIDNGIGLPAEHRDRLTEPYVTTRARGTGLGLAIVKKIVEEHAGTLDLVRRAGWRAPSRGCASTAARCSPILAMRATTPRRCAKQDNLHGARNPRRRRRSRHP